MKKYKLNGFLSFIYILAALLVVSMCSFGLYNSDLVKNYRSYYIRRQADAICRALEYYGSTHKIVDTATIHTDAEKNNTYYNQLQSYPKTLNELIELQSAGYFDKSIHLGSSGDFDEFNYTPVSTTVGGVSYVTNYVLTVKLPNGNTFTRNSFRH